MLTNLPLLLLASGWIPYVLVSGNNVFEKDYKIVRFMDILDIRRIYKIFKISQIDETIRTVNNRKKIIHEWIITCKKWLKL